MNLINSTFQLDECIFLLENLTGKIKETSFWEKEKLLSNGVNYAEMITKEMPITDEINAIFKSETQKYATRIAGLVGNISKKMYSCGKDRTVIVSLARAGSPIGVLIKRYLALHGIEVPHYSISIVRGKGIDENALDYIRERHPDGIMMFVDAWTGKGSITNELIKSINKYNLKRKTNIGTDLTVLADPACISTMAGTREDICIPNACLNSTVSGLVSRTICNEKFIADGGFHGAVYFDYLAEQDMTNFFLDTISKSFIKDDSIYDSYCIKDTVTDRLGMEGGRTISSIAENVLKHIAKDYPGIPLQKVKLSIGESSRALIRRRPYALLVRPDAKHGNDEGLWFVMHLATQKKIDIVPYNHMGPYKCIALLE